MEDEESHHIGVEEEDDDSDDSDGFIDNDKENKDPLLAVDNSSFSTHTPYSCLPRISSRRPPLHSTAFQVNELEE